LSQHKYTAEEHGLRIEEFLKKLLAHLGLDVKFTIEPGGDPRPELENPDLIVKFTGRDLDGITENRAEVLMALEHLTVEMLRMPHEDHSKLRFDANDMRLLRIEELRANALTAAERVRKTHSPFRFNPMSSRERRILHLALRAYTDIRSESEGFEPRRNVVLYPADMPSKPQPAPPFPPRSRDRR
jgi:spoIIIJ-associated protein